MISTLTSALEDGQAEIDAADRNDPWNVTARFWPRTGQFSASDLNGQPSMRHDCFPSDLIRGHHAAAYLEDVVMGHGDVVAMISLVPYLRAGHDPSVAALAGALLDEAQRMVDLGLWIGESTEQMLLLRRANSTHPLPTI